MVENIDDINIDAEEDGQLVVETLDKHILSKGAWATVLFRYREMDRKTEAMGPVKFSIRRYKKMKGLYKQQSKFNISSAAQARALCEKLGEWLARDGEGADG